MTIQILKGSAVDPSSSSNNDILDSSNEQVVIPAGALIKSIVLHGVSLQSGADLSIGWNSDNDGVLPVSAGLTSDLLSVDRCYRPSNLNGAMAGSYALRLYSSATITGQVQMIISYVKFEDDF
jgi:hypothetical protein